MAGAVAAGGNEYGFEARWTWTVFFCCLSASAGGALFGYDNGVMGGVQAMDGFLRKFLPSVIDNPDYGNHSNLYCTYNNQILQLMTSSLFLAGTVCEVTGTTAFLSRYHGRKRVMMYSGLAFMIAAILLATSFNIAQIFVGRVLQGIAISFASVSVPIYNSEMAPPAYRGRLNQLFQLVLTFFIWVAQLINLIIFAVKATRWGWRFSLGFAFVPSFILFLGGVFLPDSPNSLLERGYPEQARKNLEYVRGTPNVDKEFAALSEAADLAKQVKHPWVNIFSRKYRPQLILSASATLFQQWTGINILIFYAPQIFNSFNATQIISLVAALILGSCNHLSTYVSFWTADKFGRRALFLQAGVQMAIALIIIAVSLKTISNPSKSIWEAWYVLGFTCLFDMAYAWSYGPLAWLYPTEIQPLDTRSAGLAVASCMNLLFSFVIGQSFLTMLCSLKEWTFMFFAGCVIVMTIFVYFFYVETKNVPIEECPFLFWDHWFWKRYARSGVGFQEKLVVHKKMQQAEETGEPLRLPKGMEKVHEEVLFEIKQYGHILSPEEADEMQKAGTLKSSDDDKPGSTEMAQMSKGEFDKSTKDLTQ
ncbi:hypothetical protein WJX73_006127 [Symbiochloris irregularis]|uniref:Major facilitator superfamily (MFS) profile domain-containing protein n=1 Tax=Symbiochloris irregularis TaxID=706552 RepID=A0AAW1P061_9CHLO